MKIYMYLTFLVCSLCFKCKEIVFKGPIVGDVLYEHLDTSVVPGEDFFMFANGTWLKNNPIPSEETNWGLGI